MERAHTGPTGEEARAQSPRAAAPAHPLLRLQAQAGNAAVSRLVMQRSIAPREGAGGAEEVEVEADQRVPTSGIGPAPEGESDREEMAVQRHRIPTDVVGPPPPGEADTVTREEGGAGGASGVQREGGDSVGTVVVYPSYSDLNGGLRTETSAAWQSTLGATIDGSRREQGFWVRWNKDTRAITKTSDVISPTVDNATGASVDLGAKPADTATNFTVGSFHTHTPTRYRTVARAAGPSDADISVDTSDNVAGMVYDYVPDENGNVPARHPLRSPAQLSASGPNRRR